MGRLWTCANCERHFQYGTWTLREACQECGHFMLPLDWVMRPVHRYDC